MTTNFISNKAVIVHFFTFFPHSLRDVRSRLPSPPYVLGEELLTVLVFFVLERRRVLMTLLIPSPKYNKSSGCLHSSDIRYTGIVKVILHFFIHICTLSVHLYLRT